MEKDPDRWKKLCVTVVELAGILVLALEFTIQTVIYSFGYALSGPEISVKDLWVVLPGALSSILLMCLFSCMQPDKVWDYQRNQKPHRYVFWLYGVSVFLYIFNLFITVTGSSLSGYIFLFLIFGGGEHSPSTSIVRSSCFLHALGYVSFLACVSSPSLSCGFGAWYCWPLSG